MTQTQANELPVGVYRIHWESGGNGVAVLARLANGTMCFSPANWCCQFSQDWGSLKNVTLIERAFEDCNG